MALAPFVVGALDADDTALCAFKVVGGHIWGVVNGRHRSCAVAHMQAHAAVGTVGMVVCSLDCEVGETVALTGVAETAGH